MLATIKEWSVKRRRLIAGVAGAVVETTAACVPGVGIAAKILGTLIEKGTAEALAPDEKPTAEQLAAVNTWLAKLSDHYDGLLARLERLPDPASVEDANERVRAAIQNNQELAAMFDAHLIEMRQATLSLGVIERKLDEHFHVQQQVHASIEEIKEVFVGSPMMADWNEFRRARPEAVRVLNEADEHFRCGRREEGVRALLGLLSGSGAGQRTIAHSLGLIEFGQGKVSEAAARMTGIGGALQRTGTRLSTLGGRKAGAAWRSLPRGFVINRKYRIEDEVGRGGMASVYRAVPARSFDDSKEVAIKVPTVSDDAAFGQRFEKEIVRTRKLKHPNIVHVEGYEIFDEPHTKRESYALVMEYVPGRSLSRYLEMRKSQGKPLSIDEVRTAMKCVCDGLEYAHGVGILHRDIKPHNVLVAHGTIKLMDFGIGAEIDDSTRVTRAGDVLGTPAYMPPEMHSLDPNDPPGVAADVYMLGVLLRELLTFHPNGKLDRPDLPREWRELIRDARQADPSDRPESVVAFRARLLETKTGEEKVAPKTTEPTAPVQTKPIASPPEVKAVPKQAGRTTAETKPTVAVPAVSVALRKALPKTITNSIGMTFVLIPAGTFLMGSPEGEEGRYDNEKQHWVTLTKPFYLGIHPVTQKQWTAVMGKNPSWFSSRGEGEAQVQGMKTDDFPVENVSWEDAKTFLGALNLRPEEKEKGREYRLPMEAEWEYACRGGASSSEPCHFGKTISVELANYNQHLGRTSKVGSYPANAFGLHDMHGNVWEWCDDWHGEYPDGEPPDPSGPPGGSIRVLRGGSWNGYGGVCRAACRGGSAPEYRSRSIGFRAAVVPSSR